VSYFMNAYDDPSLVVFFLSCVPGTFLWGSQGEVGLPPLGYTECSG
jgi:hypothetical protein